MYMLSRARMKAICIQPIQLYRHSNDIKYLFLNCILSTSQHRLCVRKHIRQILRGYDSDIDTSSQPLLLAKPSQAFQLLISRTTKNFVSLLLISEHNNQTTITGSCLSGFTHLKSRPLLGKATFLNHF